MKMKANLSFGDRVHHLESSHNNMNVIFLLEQRE